VLNTVEWHTDMTLIFVANLIYIWGI